MDGGGRTASGTAVERSLQRILRPRHSHIHVLRNAGSSCRACSRRAKSLDPCLGVAEPVLSLPKGRSDGMGGVE
jgi:hypothetical protein